MLSAPGATDYWVDLAPLASAQDSLRQLKELQARKIDSYIIAQGDLVNGVSLDIFARADMAQSVIRLLRAAGYQPKLRELARAQRTYWVCGRVQSTFGRCSLAEDFFGLSHQLIPCKSIAATLYFA